MKGQTLFVRYSNESDFASILALHTAAGIVPPLHASSVEGLLGRLAGNTVAYLEWHRAGDAMAISHILVSSEFRGLRIGRGLLTEATSLAAAEGALTVRVAQDCKLASFFQRCGFLPDAGALQRATR